MRSFEKTQIGFVWTTGHCFLLLGLSTVKGVQIEPCGDGGVVEVLSGQNTSFTCRSEGNVQWKLLTPLNDSNNSFLLSNCTENVCQAVFLGETFVASVRNNDTKVMTVDAVNNTKIHSHVQLVNGSLQCDIVKNYGTNQSLYIVGSASCGLNYVYPSENVECNAVQNSSSIDVSCVIGSVYSSRSIYKCHLFQRISKSYENRLETVTMGTSPTSEKITKTEVKVSGSCQFNTTLLPEEGLYSFVVSISPGGRNYSVKLTDDSRLTTEPPNDIYNMILAGVSGVIVLLVISLVICLIIKKKTKDGRKKESTFVLYEDPRDMVILTMDDVRTAANTRMQQHRFVGSEQDEIKGTKQDLLGAGVYETPWDAVPAHLMMEEMEAGYVQIQEAENLMNNAVDNTKWKSRFDGHPDQDDDGSTEKRKGRKHGTKVPAHLMMEEMEAGYVQILEAESLMHNALDNAKWKSGCDGHPDQDDDRSTEKKNGRKLETKGQENQVSTRKKYTIEGSNDDIADSPPEGAAAVVNNEYMTVGLLPRQLKSALHTDGTQTAVSSQTSGARGQKFGDRGMSESSCFPSNPGQEWDDLHVHETVYSLATVMPT